MHDWIIKADLYRLQKQLADASAEDRVKLINLIARKESLLAPGETKSPPPRQGQRDQVRSAMALTSSPGPKGFSSRLS